MTPRHALAALIGTLLITVGASGTSAAAATSGYRVTTVYFRVVVGPDHEACDVVADLYQPDGADSEHAVPAVLMTNGFGGSKDTEAPIGKFFAQQGYGVLLYSGLGFGGSSCEVRFADPAYDGAGASQLIDFLGGVGANAFEDAAHSQPMPAPDWIVKDARDHHGIERDDDPRVGMFGISYGGGTALAAASVDPRLDAIVPVATWNDLTYSLFPNSAEITRGVTSATPGLPKTSLGALFDAYFSAAIVACRADNSTPDCSAFYATLVADITARAAAGYPDAEMTERLTRASTSRFASSIVAPTLLIQAQRDTLFNLNEAIATYEQLRSQQTAVAMVWTSGGHTAKPIGGDYDFAAPSVNQYPFARTLDWFAHYLRDDTVSTGPAFAYLRDWRVSTDGAFQSYATAATYPVGTARTWFLGPWQNLVDDPSRVGDDTQSFLTGPSAVPLSISPVYPLEMAGLNSLFPDVNLPGTFARWATPVLTSPIRVVGQPELDVQVRPLLPSSVPADSPLGQRVTLFAKVLDVAPDGSRNLINLQVAPVRIADTNRLVHIVLPAIAHEFSTGHRIEIDLAGANVNYSASTTDHIVSVRTSALGQALRLPVVP